MVDRTHRELTDEDISKIARVYHAWRGDYDSGEYGDIKGFCKSVAIEEVSAQNYVLTPGRYVGIDSPPEDDEPFEERIERLTSELRAELSDRSEVEERILASLRRVGYG